MSECRGASFQVPWVAEYPGPGVRVSDDKILKKIDGLRDYLQEIKSEEFVTNQGLCNLGSSRSEKSREKAASWGPRKRRCISHAAEPAATTTKSGVVQGSNLPVWLGYGTTTVLRPQIARHLTSNMSFIDRIWSCDRITTTKKCASKSTLCGCCPRLDEFVMLTYNANTTEVESVPKGHTSLVRDDCEWIMTRVINQELNA